MDHRRRVDPDSEVLPEPAATRLLARASELDAARTSGIAVAELRAAAAEAGITSGAFDAALVELRDGSEARVPDVSGRPRRRAWRSGLAAGIAALLTIGTFAVLRTVTPAGSAAPMVEEAILLRCLAPGEAAELIRPLLDLRTNTIEYSPARAPRVVTIRATPAQIQEVRSVIDQHESAGSPACASGLLPAPAP